MHRPGFLILSMMCTYTENSSIQKKNLEILGNIQQRCFYIQGWACKNRDNI